jgi:hypothetical protein
VPPPSGWASDFAWLDGADSEAPCDSDSEDDSFEADSEDSDSLDDDDGVDGGSTSGTEGGFDAVGDGTEGGSGMGGTVGVVEREAQLAAARANATRSAILAAISLFFLPPI